MSQTPFSLGTFADGQSGPFPGIVVNDRVYDTRTVLPAATTTSLLLADWDASLDALQSLADAPEGEGRLVGELTVLAPVQPPGQIFGAGANYREHVIQITVAHRLGKADATEESCASRPPGRWTSVPRTASPMCGWASRPRSAARTTT